ncbi:hypothetical protein WUBG_05980, partial [Wuchereria bancrofti]
LPVWRKSGCKKGALYRQTKEKEQMNGSTELLNGFPRGSPGRAGSRVQAEMSTETSFIEQSEEIDGDGSQLGIARKEQ